MDFYFEKLSLTLLSVLFCLFLLVPQFNDELSFTSWLSFNTVKRLDAVLAGYLGYFFFFFCSIPVLGTGSRHRHLHVLDSTCSWSHPCQTRVRRLNGAPSLFSTSNSSAHCTPPVGCSAFASFCNWPADFVSLTRTTCPRNSDTLLLRLQWSNVSSFCK